MTSAPANDYADWLPPVLVKELRQGLRTHVFAGLFALVQAGMVTVMAFRLLSTTFGNDDFSMSLQDNLEWCLIASVLLVILPARGLAAISSETKAQTAELITLSSISTARLVWGKWIALIGQTLLLVIAILPYYVLRYFFGGFDVALRLAALGWIVAMSLALTALFIALSPCGRASMLATALAVYVPVTGFTFSLAFSNYDTYSSGPSFLAMLLPILLAVPFLLTVACHRIAGHTEMFSPPLRLLGVLALIMAAIGELFDHASSDQVWIIMAAPAIVWCGIEAMMEPVKQVPGAFVNWTRRGAIGKLAGRLFYSGWCTGMVFVPMLFIATTAAILATEDPGLDEIFGAFVLSLQAAVTLMAPRAILELIPRFRWSFWGYWIVQGASLFWAFVAENAIGFRDFHEAAEAVLMALTPASSCIWMAGHNGSPDSPEWLLHLAIAGIIDVVVIAILIRRRRDEMQTIRRMEAESIALHPAPVRPNH